MERIGDVFWISDPAHKKLLYASQAFEDIWGRDLQQLYDHFETWVDAIHEEDRDRVKHEFFTKIYAGQYDSEYRVVRPDGTIRWIRDHGKPLAIGNLVAGVAEDITSRKQVEDALRKTQELLQETEKIGHVGGWEFDIDTRKQTWTDEVYRIHEVSREFEPTIDKGIAFYAPASKPTIGRVIQRAIELGESFDVELEFITAKGNRRWVHAIGKQDVAQRRVHGFFQDITERKKAEEALRVSEEQFRSFFENAASGMAQLDATGRFSNVNDRFCQITGYSRDELLNGMGPLDLDHPDDVEADRQRIANFFLSRTPYLFQEKRYVHKGGAILWVRVTAAPIRDVHGVVCTTAAVIEDVTARKQAERALLASEERFRTMAQAVPSFLFETDAAGWNIWTSEGWCRFTGQTPEQVAGHGWATALHPDDRAANIDRWMQCMKDSVPFESQQRLRRSDGTYALVIARALPVRDSQGTVTRWVGSVTNVDEIVRAREALSQSEERLRLALEGGDLGSWDVNMETGLAQWNQQHALMQGYEPSSRPVSIGKWQDRVHPDDLGRVMAAIERAKADHGLFAEDHRIVRADNGEERWLSLYGRFSYDERGVPVRFSGVSQDITDRKQAEDKLRHVAADLALAQRIAKLGNWRFDAATDRLVLSDELCRVFDIDPASSGEGYESFLALVHPDDRPGVVQANVEARSNGTPFDAEFRIVARDGSVKTMHEFGNATRNSAGCVVGLFGTVQDITERKRVETALRESEQALQRLNATLETRVRERTAALAEANERFDWVARATTDGVWDSDLLRTTTYFSPRWKEMHGFQEGDRSESQQEWLARIHPEHRPRVQDHFEASLRGEREGFWEEYRIQRKDGTYFWVLDRGIAIRDAQGRVVRMVGVDTDITWRKEVEEALCRRAQEFRALADNVPALFSYVDRDRRYRFVNQRYEELFSRPDEELVGLTVRDLLGPDGYTRVEPYLDRALSGERVSFEYELAMPGTGVRYLSAQYVPDRDAQGQVAGLFLLLSDVTALKTSEALLREREAQLRDLGAKLLRAQEEERRRISRDLHDDVMQRMGALALELYGLAGTTSSHEVGLQSQLRACGASAEQLTTDLQRMAHQLHPSMLEYVGLESAVREHINEFTARTGLSVEIITRNVPRELPLDHATCLYRVLQEGLQNVQKHANATSVLVRLLRTGQGLGLCVHDDGRGIENSEGAVRRKGLGLTSMAERVGMLNGTFRIRTKPGDGTEIHAWVPLLEELKGET